MAICMQCGAMMHDEDMEKHVCLEEDKPEKGTPIRKGYKKGE
jgi:hypothetical protein